MFCGDRMTASVTAFDRYNSAVGPFTLDLTIDPHNEAPVVTNLDTTVSYREKPGSGYTVLDLATVDSTVFDSLNIHMWSDSPAGMELYRLSGTKLQTKLNPKYVREDIRSVTLKFLLDDGFCTSPTYSLTVEVEDFNERPRIYTTEPFLEAYEGEINVPHNIEIIDEEQAGGFTYALSRSNDVFDIDVTSGNITTKPGVSVDLDSQIDRHPRLGGNVPAGDEANVLLRVYDANDNPPYFAQATYSMAADECSVPGSILGQVEGKDDDSVYNQNNFFYFGGGGTGFVVMTTGEVPCIAQATSTTPPTVVTTARRDPKTEEGVYMMAVLCATLGVTWVALTAILVLRACCCPVYHAKSAGSHLVRSEKSNADPEKAANSDAKSDSTSCQPSRRVSFEVPPETQMEEKTQKEGTEFPFSPLFRNRKQSNPFVVWKRRVMAYYRKHVQNTKDNTEAQPKIDFPNGFDPSKRKSTLPDVETISMTLEERDGTHLLPAERNGKVRASLTTPTSKANTNGRLGGIQYIGIDRRGSNVSANVKQNMISIKHVGTERRAPMWFNVVLPSHDGGATGASGRAMVYQSSGSRF
ncbi:hypothetical protein EGW08_003612 [Elysia chlorotica]|uniref:Cadherin domain-containing protein n=1 Tax=Elysia chlorotica TaxID=188477 RepID=A0A3S0ZXT5_ELYCH|nr:hypothetical protein EGW08_003612 [Elysia chlorotica]